MIKMLKKNRTAVRVFSLMLALAAVLGAAIPVLAAENKYDLSNKDSEVSSEFDAVSLIEEHIGQSLSAAESAFLESYSTLTFKYNDVINANNVALDHKDGVLTVTAKPYTYTANGGKKLVWIPQNATVGNTRIPLMNVESGYVGSIESAEPQDVNVVYSAAAELSKDDFNCVLNLYHDTAKYAYDIADYEAKCEAYEAYLYEKHLYDDRKAEYDAYLQDYAEYEQQLYVYDNFDKLMAQYSADLDEYNAYIVRLESLAAEIKKYEEYEKKLARIEKQLSAFELVYVKMKNDRDVYGAVMGGTVDQVLGSVGKIIAELGGSFSSIVKTAESATKSFRGLMAEYKACETTEEKYIFYTSNYTKMCDSVLDLAWALDRLYYAPGVEAMAKAMEKHESYVILVAQLVLISNALIDGAVDAGEGSQYVKYDGSWTIDKRSANAVLNNVVYFEDDDSSAPLDGGYPVAVKKPDVKEVAKPTIPQRPSTKPVAPEVVSDPGAAPKELPNPIYPSAASFSAAEIYSKLSASDRAELAAKKSDGTIIRRVDAEQAKTLILQVNVYKKYDCESIVLIFDVASKGAGTLSFKHEIVTDKNSAVLYDGPLPSNYSDGGGSYEFAGWRVKGTTEKADFSKGFEQNTVFVPFYDVKPKYYNVTWVVDGKEYAQSYAAGEIPVPSFEPTKADEGNCFYKFVGWLRDGQQTRVDMPIFSDVTYEAKFESKYLLPSGTGGASITRNDDSVICDVSEFTNPLFKVSELLPRIAGKQSLTLISTCENGNMPKFTLSFSFTDVIKMNEAGVRSVILTRSVTKDGESITLSLRDQSNAALSETDITPQLTVGHTLGSVSNLVLISGGEYVNSKIEAGSVSLKAKPSFVYVLKPEFHVTAVKNQLCEVKADKTLGTRGDKVSVSVVPKPGVSVVGIDVIDANGNPVANFDGTSFSLTESDVIISVRAKYILYNVEFVSSGVVISRQELIYGEMPVPPPNPSVATDGDFSYEFTGWSPEIAAVVANATYEAIFEKTPVTHQYAPSPDDPIANIMKYVKIALIAFAVLAACGIGLLVFFIVKWCREKKLGEQTASKENDADTDNTDGKKRKKGKKMFGKVKNSKKNKSADTE